jgi:hypothetical protein
MTTSTPTDRYEAGRAAIGTRREEARAAMRANADILNDPMTSDGDFFARSKLRFRLRPPRDGELPLAAAEMVLVGFSVIVAASRTARLFAALPPREAQRALEATVRSGWRYDDDAMRSLLLANVVVKWFDLPAETDDDTPDQDKEAAE